MQQIEFRTVDDSDLDQGWIVGDDNFYIVVREWDLLAFVKLLFKLDGNIFNPKDVSSFCIRSRNLISQNIEISFGGLFHGSIDLITYSDYEFECDYDDKSKPDANDKLTAIQDKLSTSQLLRGTKYINLTLNYFSDENKLTIDERRRDVYLPKFEFLEFLLNYRPTVFAFLTDKNYWHEIIYQGELTDIFYPSIQSQLLVKQELYDHCGGSNVDLPVKMSRYPGLVGKFAYVDTLEPYDAFDFDLGDHIDTYDEVDNLAEFDDNPELIAQEQAIVDYLFEGRDYQREVSYTLSKEKIISYQIPNLGKN